MKRLFVIFATITPWAHADVNSPRTKETSENLYSSKQASENEFPQIINLETRALYNSGGKPLHVVVWAGRPNMKQVLKKVDLGKNPGHDTISYASTNIEGQDIHICVLEKGWTVLTNKLIACVVIPASTFKGYPVIRVDGTNTSTKETQSGSISIGVQHQSKTYDMSKTNTHNLAYVPVTWNPLKPKSNK